MRDDEFLWGTGIEGSEIPHLGIRQYDWTGHDRRWRDDLRRIAERLGPCWLRYPLSWEQGHPGPGRFAWGPVEERVAFAAELGLRVVAGLCHFGTPAWIASAFGDPDFPTALAEWADAAGERLGPHVAAWVPVNEPLVTALFSGDVGLWPPFGRGWRAYMPVLCRVAEAQVRATAALRARARGGVGPEICPEVWWVEAIEDHRSDDPRLAEELRRRNARRFLVLDLASGRVDDDHPLCDWLLEHGFPPYDLEWLRRNAQAPDRLGLDYYRQSEIHVWLDGDQPKQRLPDHFRGLAPLAEIYHRRFGWPLVVTETNAMGRDDEKLAWMDEVVRDVCAARAAGVPITGLFWWPAFDHVDWDGAMLHHSGNVHPVGLWRLAPDPHGDGHHLEETPAAGRFAELAAGAACLPPLPAAGEGVARAAVEPIPEEPAREPDGVPVVVHSHIRWSSVWQRPQQLASRLAARHPLLFVEEPQWSAEVVRGKVQISQPVPGVTLAVPVLPRSLATRPIAAGHLAAELLGRRLAGPLARFASAVHLVYTPLALPVVDAFAPPLALAYDCMDELADFAHAVRDLREREDELLERADLVLARGEAVFLDRAARHPNVHWLPGGVDPDFWAHPGAAPHDVAFVPRPRLGYMGAVDERLDYDLLRRLGERNPGWSLVFVGPVLKVDPAKLPRGHNFFYLGQRPYASLPAYLAALDVALMPFAPGPATRRIHPTKTLEYLAAGKPVVATPIPELERHFAEAIHLAPAAAFEERLHDVLAGRRIDPAVGLERARRQRWDDVVARVDELLEAARAARAVLPAASGRAGLGIGNRS